MLSIKLPPSYTLAIIIVAQVSEDKSCIISKLFFYSGLKAKLPKIIKANLYVSY